MNRKIQKRLVAAGHAPAPDEPPAKPFFAWFNEDVLGLDSEPGCVPALADPAAERTALTPRRLLGWLLRRRSA